MWWNKLSTALFFWMGIGAEVTCLLADGSRHGFELWNNVSGNPLQGGTSAGSRQLTSALCTDCTRCPCFQPLEFTVLDDRTLQLNTTFISGKAASLRYAFHDYPTMLVFGADGRPAPPFNVSVPFRATGK